MKKLKKIIYFIYKMDGYTLNNNPWGGSFILEASTNGISWDTMVAKSSNDTFLGREGLSTGGGG
jgi:hypothetical protein